MRLILLVGVCAVLFIALACGGGGVADHGQTPSPAPSPTTEPPASSMTPTVEPQANCDPSYPDVCITVGSADFDCAGGSGNGPNYIVGPIRVLPPDPHGLDPDGDGTGCD